MTKHSERVITWCNSDDNNLITIVIKATKGGNHDDILKISFMDARKFNDKECAIFTSNIFKHDLCDLRDMFIDCCEELSAPPVPTEGKWSKQ